MDKYIEEERINMVIKLIQRGCDKTFILSLDITEEEYNKAEQMETKRFLDALESVLKKRYPSNSFNLSGYQEDSVCLQYENNSWIIYNGERGNRYNEIKCDTILKACLELIRKMTHRIEDISIMENELLLLLTKVA